MATIAIVAFRVVLLTPMHLSRHNFKSYFTLKGINKVVRILTLSDVLLLGSAGLVTPIFAIFVVGNIKGGTVEVAGIAATVYLVTKSFGQLFAAEIIDRIKGELDDFWTMFYGSIGMSLAYLLYVFISTPIQLYLVQFFLGVAAAFTFPSWMAIFTRHIDRNHEGREWGIYYTMTDLAAAITAGIGGTVAYRLGFIPLFIK